MEEKKEIYTYRSKFAVRSPESEEDSEEFANIEDYLDSLSTTKKVEKREDSSSA